MDSGVVVRSVASQQGSNPGWGLSVWSLHAPPVCAWLISGYYGFLPLSKEMHVGLNNDSTLTLGASVSMHVFCLWVVLWWCGDLSRVYSTPFSNGSWDRHRLHLPLTLLLHITVYLFGSPNTFLDISIWMLTLLPSPQQKYILHILRKNIKLLVFKPVVIVFLLRFGTLWRNMTQAALQVEGKTAWMCSMMQDCCLWPTLLEHPTEQVTLLHTLLRLPFSRVRATAWQAGQINVHFYNGTTEQAYFTCK